LSTEPRSVFLSITQAPEVAGSEREQRRLQGDRQRTLDRVRVSERRADLRTPNSGRIRGLLQVIVLLITGWAVKIVAVKGKSE
jgi:hypothetical protein